MDIVDIVDIVNIGGGGRGGERRRVFSNALPTRRPLSLALLRPQAFPWGPWRICTRPCELTIAVAGAVAGWLSCLGIVTRRQVGLVGVRFAMLIGEFTAL